MVLCCMLMLQGCDKHHAKKLSGTYRCRVDYHHWSMNGPYIDSTYYEDIIIERHEKNLIILGKSIHINELWKEEYESGTYSQYFNVRFTNDSVYILKGGGGQGGSGSLSYAGRKLKE